MSPAELGLPDIALSVRQPWAWAIVYAGKDIENRTGKAISFFPLPIRRRIAIHAAKGLTREEYEGARDFMRGIGIECPPAIELARGGVIGSADVVDVVRQSESKWFFGPCGLVLANAKASPRVAPARGQLGYFKWQEESPAIAVEPARWMLPPAAQGALDL